MFEAKVESLSFRGLGVIKHPNGKVFYSEGCWPEDYAQFEIIKEKKNYGFARIVKLLKPSPSRRDVPCSYQGFSDQKCGGCSWMIADYESQKKQKINILNSLIKRYKIDFSNKIDSLIAGDEFSYKNRAQVHLQSNNLGFYAKASKKVINIKQCQVLNSKTQEQLEFIQNNKEKFSKEKIYLDDRLSIDELLAEKNLGFRQGNSYINSKMRATIKALLPSYKKGIELFCGAGNFSEILIENGERLQAFDYKIPNSPSILNVSFVESDLFKNDFFSMIDKDSDFLFLDPPRSGMKNLNHLVSELKNLQSIFYLSCSPDSMLQDIVSLKNFRIKKIIPFDAYPQTPHLEVLSILEKI